MPIETTCPHCQATYRLADHLRGRTVRCKQCRKTIAVGDDAPHRKEAPEETAPRKARPRRKGPIVGLVPLVVLAPLMFLGLVLGFFVPWVVRGTGALGLIVAAVGFVMCYRLCVKHGFKEAMDETAYEYNPGAALLFTQVGYAFDYPRRFACWVSLQVLGIVVLITAGVMATVLPRGDAAPSPSAGQPSVQQTGPAAPQAPRVTGDPETDLLLAGLDDESRPANRVLAANRFAEMQPNAHRSVVARKLAEVVEGKKGEFGRGEALKALGVWATANEVPALLRCFQDPILRDGAGRALRAVGPAAEKDVLNLLNDPDTGVRSEAAGVLKEIGTRQSLPALQAESDRNDARTRDRVREALAAIQARAGK